MKLLTKGEVAEQLGVSKETVYRLSRDGQLNTVKIRRATRYTQESIDRLVRENSLAVEPETAKEC